MDRVSVSNGKSVLLVADDGPTGLSLLRGLESATIQVEWARSVSEVRTRAACEDLHTPAVVFLDVDLPDAADEELVSLVRESFPLAAVIALAGELSGEDAVRLLWQGVPYLNKPVSPLALAGLALRLTSPGLARGSWPPIGYAPALLAAKQRGAHLESILRSYVVDRVLSKQQQLILREYLNGKNDKQIALSFHCSEATVYEHWRRMARKAGGSQKSDVIADFHRFLGGD